nr:unnamed protein product [Digitaria exilis]
MGSDNAAFPFTTTTTSPRFCNPISHRSCLRDKVFDILVIDEAANLKECESMIPLASRRINHVVLVGDDKQLQSVVKSTIAKEKKFGRSLYERLSELGFPKHMLKIQYRMHPSISKFPNEEFYAGGLEDGPNVKDYNNTYLDGHMYGPYSFIHVEDGYEENIGQGSRNIVEADVAANIVARLAEVCTVDSCQGDEKDIIILSTVRHNRSGNIGFLECDKRTNVALTRAKNCMWILGHETTLLQHKTTWSRLVKDAKDRQCFFDARDDYSLARAMDQSVRDNVSRPNIKFQCAPDAQLAGDSCGEASMDNNPTASLHEASHDMMSVDENLLKYSGEASKENQADSSKDNKKIEEKTMCDDSANSAKTKMCDDDKNDVNAEGNKEIQDTTEGNKVKEVPMQAEVAAEKTCQLLPSCSRKRINSLQEDQPAGQFAEQVHLAQLPPRPSRKKACLSQSAPIAQVTVEMAALEDAQIDLLGALPQLAEAVARTPVNYEERKEREKLVDTTTSWALHEQDAEHARFAARGETSHGGDLVMGGTSDQCGSLMEQKTDQWTGCELGRGVVLQAKTDKWTGCELGRGVVLQAKTDKWTGCELGREAMLIILRH